jgi:PAT family beta-lactamase induction signal transducer AmpG
VADKDFIAGEPDSRGRRISPWAWVPTAYLAEGIPFTIAMTTSVLMFKSMGLPNTQVALWTSALYIPWTVKPLWAPLVDRYGSKRGWTVLMQLVLGIALAATSLSLLVPGMFPLMENMPMFFALSLMVLWVVAISSSTHDLACDGFYMLALNERQQAFFVGIRSTFYRMAALTATGILPIVVGSIQGVTGPQPMAITVVAQAPGESLTDEEITAAIAGAPQGIFDRLSGLSRALIPDQRTGEGMAIVVEQPRILLEPGTTGEVTVRLSEAPPVGREVAVRTDAVRGDGALSIKSGERLVFTDQTWNVPQAVTFEAKALIPGTVGRDFEMTAGNITLSWAIVFVGLGVFFVGLFLWHSFILPYPTSDMTDTVNRPPFYKPAFWLFIAVILPVGLGIALYVGMGYARVPLAQTLNVELAGLREKIYDFVFASMRFIIIGLIAFAVLKWSTTREPLGQFYSELSARSEIGFADTFYSFFQKPAIGISIAFLLLFRLGEAHIVKLGQPFLLDDTGNGGLFLTVTQVGVSYGTIGTVCLTIGGIIGGLLVALYGLKRVIWPMVLAMNLPNLLYVYMAIAQPESWGMITFLVGLEQLGYGFGFTAFMVYMLYIAQGDYKTSHFALCTGFMALGMMIPGMWSGFLQDITGYVWFFVIAVVLTIPGMALIPFLPLSEEFGRKAHTEKG